MSKTTKKPIPPWKLVVIFWASAGIYGVIWFFEILGEINRLSGRKLFNRKFIALSAIFMLVLFAFIVYYIYMKFSTEQVFWIEGFFASFFLAMLWDFSIIRMLYLIGKEIGNIQEKRGISPRATGKETIFSLFQTFAIPYLQKHYISIIENDTDIAKPR